jgi:hypothetical protein
MFKKINLLFFEDMDLFVTLNVATFKNILCISIMTNFIHIRFASIWPSQFSKNLFPQSSP